MSVFNKDHAPACKYCLFSKKVSDDDYLCKFRGVLTADEHCGKFKYDPLKREPKRQLKIEKYSENDFSLD